MIVRHTPLREPSSFSVVPFPHCFDPLFPLPPFPIFYGGKAGSNLLIPNSAPIPPNGVKGGKRSPISHTD
jgi:hypothetical protein